MPGISTLTCDDGINVPCMPRHVLRFTCLASRCAEQKSIPFVVHGVPASPNCRGETSIEGHGTKPKKSLSRALEDFQRKVFQGPGRIFFTDRWLPVAPLIFTLQAPQVYVSWLLVSTAESNLRINFSIPGETNEKDFFIVVMGIVRNSRWLG